MNLTDYQATNELLQRFLDKLTTPQKPSQLLTDPERITLKWDPDNDRWLYVSFPYQSAETLRYVWRNRELSGSGTADFDGATVPGEIAKLILDIIQEHPNPQECPFCGNEVQTDSLHRPSPTHYFVRCDHCKASGPIRVGKDDALTAWNTLDSPLGDILLAAKDITDEMGPCKVVQTWCLSHAQSDPCPIAYLRDTLTKTTRA